MKRSLIISTIVTLIMVPIYQVIYFSRSLDKARAIELGIPGEVTDGQIIANGFNYLLSYKNPINYFSDNWSFLVLGILIAFVSSTIVLNTKKGSGECT
jgi:hypothetical protein